MKPTFEFEKDSLFFVNDIVDPYSGYENSFNRAQCLNLTLSANLIYIRVFHHFFKQSKTESAVLNVFQDLKSKISEKLDQN